MAISQALDWLSNTYNTVLDNTLHRIDTFYLLITHSERAAIAFLAGLLILYVTVALTVLFDEAYQAYKRMPR